LIAPNWALTAAHCIDGKDASVIDILVGAHRLSESGLRVQGDLVIVHPGYDPATLDSDLALVRLSTSVTQTPIALYAPVAGADELRFMRATVTGWGINDSGSFPDALREVALPLVDRKTCADTFLTPVTENMICAGYRPLTKTACYGDSGGPLMVQNEGGQWLQIGIVSWGPATCISDSGYDVYTRVGNYQAWIQACIDDPDTLQCNGADLFEPDDSAPAAQPYTTWGEAQVHTFHVRGDQDWLTFDVVEGRTYVINTEHEITAASTVNTVVWLYGADGHTPITFSDGRGLVMSTHAAAGAYAWGTPDPGFGPEVKSDVTVLWTADRTGTVYAGVENLALSDDPNATGPYARYRITGAEYAATAYFPLLVTPTPGGAPAASAAKARY
jgi:hypothetical protein